MRAVDGIVGDDDVEVPLTGGNVADGVVRVGGTVRKPGGPQTPAVHAVLEHLAAVGFRHAPRSLGVDERGRHVLEHVPGVMADRLERDDPRVSPSALGRVARELHDALDGWEPPSDAVWACPIPADGDDLVVHNDLAPWNVVVGADRLVVIDWDVVAPGTRTWDLAYLAHGCVPLAPWAPLDASLRRLRELADGYGLDDAGRERLARTLAPRTWSMHTLLAHGHRTGEQPWARLWDEGHGEVWRHDAEWVEAHAEALRTALTHRTVER